MGNLKGPTIYEQQTDFQSTTGNASAVRRLGLWVISQKNILQTDFKGKIILQGTIWEKNSCSEKKYLSHGV